MEAEGHGLLLAHRHQASVFKYASGFAYQRHLHPYTRTTNLSIHYLSPSFRTVKRFTPSTGILTCCPSTTPFGLALGSGLPWEDLPGPGTLGFTAGGILALLIATHFSISSCGTSSAPHGTPSSAHTMLSYHNKLSIASVRHLSPVTFSAQNH